MNIYPWQSSQWQQLRAAYEADRFPHGLILSGPVGIGLEHFANSLSAAILCDAFTEQGVKKSDSRDWQLFASGNHPDKMNIKPEEAGKQIKVDQIRALIEHLQLSSQYGRKKIAVINPAENMNVSSSNGLLKTLEEPPGNSLLILISHRPDALPVTIRSRCQNVEFESKQDESTLKWIEAEIGAEHNAVQLLELAGAPLAVASLLESGVIEQRKTLLEDLASLQRKQQDPLRVADKWNKMGAGMVALSLQQFFMDMLRLKISPQPPRLQNTDLTQNLHQLIKRLDLFQLLSCYESVTGLKSRLDSRISYNTQALLEEFVLQWQEIDSMSGGKAL